MAYREFVDEHGVAWEAWDVYPMQAERRNRNSAWRAQEERRRRDGGPRAQVREEYAQGWLAFQCRGERRRLTPIPEGWDDLDTGELVALCARATPIGSPRRLVE
jgi:hypothetical protein